MRRSISYLLLVVLSVVAYTACKKKDKGPATDPNAALADTLRATCTAPFTGHGDSSEVWLPTAFSPNGDGINDVYRPIQWTNSTANYFSSFSIKVYDTLANLVFSSTDIGSPGWDGWAPSTSAAGDKYKYYVRIKYTTTHGVKDSGSTYVFLLRGTSCIAAVAADTSKYRFPVQFDVSTGYNSSWATNEVYCH